MSETSKAATTRFQIFSPLSEELEFLQSATGRIDLGPNVWIDMYDRREPYEVGQRRLGTVGAAAVVSTRWCVFHEIDAPNGSPYAETQRRVDGTLGDVLVSFWLAGARPTGGPATLTFYRIGGALQEDVRLWTPVLVVPGDAGIPVTTDVVAEATKYLAAIRALPEYSTLRVAVGFLLVALREHQPGLRLVHLWISLEGLFGVAGADGELSFRIRQRMALFLGATLAERKSIADSAKESYGFRSKVVHGSRRGRDTPADAQRTLLATERFLANALRKILNEAAMIPLFNSQDREAYLDDLALD